MKAWENAMRTPPSELLSLTFTFFNSPHFYLLSVSVLREDVLLQLRNNKENEKSAPEPLRSVQLNIDAILVAFNTCYCSIWEELFPIKA
jgi:hypothetical protein